MIEIFCEGYPQPYKLLLHAYQPTADIQFEPTVNMRYIPAGKTSYEHVEIRNEGRMPGYFSLQEVAPQKPYLTIEPTTCQLNPDEVVNVQIGMTGTSAEE